MIIWRLTNKHSLLKTGTLIGKRSELRISQRRKPKRTSKNLTTITTSKRFIKVIRTSKKEKIRTSKVFHKSDQNVKNRKYQLPMAYYLWLPKPVGPWGVRLGSIRLG